MKMHRTLIVLTALNLLLLVFNTAQFGPLAAVGPHQVVRARALEIVDDAGRVRASISVMPPSTHQDGTQYPESVLFRLITERGRPSVKISASEQASGLSFAGPTDTQDTYVILEAKGTASALTLRSEGGREQVLKP